jgi:hypothetical protein
VNVQIVKIILQRSAELTTVCFRKYSSLLGYRMFGSYTSFCVLFQCDNDLLFYFLPSNKTSSQNIDFNGLYNIAETEEHKVDRLM